MYSIVLERFAYTPHGTLGRVVLPSGVELYSLEPPWANNMPGASCIPEGEYWVRRDKTGRHQYYRVQNVPGRSDIEIHPANYFISPISNRQELWGCIALGYQLNLKSIAGITRSLDACNQLLKEIGDNSFMLKINQFKPV